MKSIICVYSLAATLSLPAISTVAEEPKLDKAALEAKYKDDPYVAALLSDNWDKVVELSSKQLADNPRHSNALIDRGYAYLRKNEQRKALADLDQAVLIDSKSHWAFYNRAQVHVACKDSEKALADYSEAIRLAPGYFFYWTGRGTVFYTTQKNDKAIADFSMALAQAPEGVFQAMVLDQRATALLAINQYDAAITDCCELIRISPTRHSYQVRGAAYYGKGDCDNALQDYSAAIRLDPKDSWSLMERGRAYAGKKDFERALADLAEAIRLTPKDEYAFRIRAWVYAANKDWDRAIGDCTQAILLDSKNSDAFQMRGEIYSEMDRFDTAINDFSTAIQLNEKNALAFAGRAFALEMNRDVKQAIADYRIAVRINPKLNKIHNQLAWHLATCSTAELRNGKEAVQHARLAGELTKWDATHLRTIAAAYAESGDFAQAVKWQKEWLANPSSGDKIQLELGEQRLKLYEEGKPLRIPQ